MPVPLGDDARRWIEARIEALTPAANSVVDEVRSYAIAAKLADAFPAPREVDPSALVEAYREAIGDMPPWAVKSAARAWLRGDVEPARRLGTVNTTFAPPPAMLRALAEHALIEVRAERFRMQRLLAARVEPDAPQRPDEATRAAQVAALTASLGTGATDAPKARTGISASDGHPATFDTAARDAQVAEWERQLKAEGY